MPTYTITTRTPIDTHCGHLIAFNEAQLTLTDQQVVTLFQIMEKVFTDGKNLYELFDLETYLPEFNTELYDIIRNAYFNCAYQPYFENLVQRAYDRLDSFGDEIDWSQIRQICIESYGYIPGNSNKEKESNCDDHFHDWFERKVIDTGLILDFERKEHLIDNIYKSNCEYSPLCKVPSVLMYEFLRNRLLPPSTLSEYAQPK